TGMGSYLPSFDYEKMYNAKNNIPIKVVGILRAAKGTSMSILSTGIAYSDELSQIVIDSAVDSDIVKAQKAVDYNILTLEKITSDKKAQLVAFLGGDEKPFMLMLYPTSFQNKDALIKYIEQYNIGKENDKIIVFTDLAGTISEMTGGIMDGVTIVLIAFSAISLVVSMIMICIITYTSVLERTKEIGVLKALGARKKDITRVFDAETLILGVFSGLLGVIIAWGITFPINIIIEKLSGLAAAAHLRLDYALILVAISTFITIIGGHVPAKIASKKDAVEALRTE
ncbi:MAG: FtsX-like permease family protein, partial [Clostridia bacterium]